MYVCIYIYIYIYIHTYIQVHVLLPLLCRVGVDGNLLVLREVAPGRFEGALDLGLLRGLVVDDEVIRLLVALAREGPPHDRHDEGRELCLVQDLLRRQPLVLRLLDADVPLQQHGLPAAVHRLLIRHQLVLPRVRGRDPAVAHGVDALRPSLVLVEMLPRRRRHLRRKYAGLLTSHS